MMLIHVYIYPLELKDFIIHMSKGYAVYQFITPARDDAEIKRLA